MLIPLISSYMQSYYKIQIDNSTTNAQYWLEEKQLWAQIGESHIFVCFFLVSVIIFIIVHVILNKKRV